MPKTWPWHAPELADTPFAANIMAAKRMDAFSFGLVCAWLLFFNWAGENRVFEDDFDSQQEPPVPVNKYLTNNNLPQQQIDVLHKLFTITLARNPVTRSDDFQQFLHLLGRERYDHET